MRSKLKPKTEDVLKRNCSRPSGFCRCFLPKSRTTYNICITPSTDTAGTRPTADSTIFPRVNEHEHLVPNSKHVVRAADH